MEYRKQGIRILALCPGETETNFGKAMGNEQPILANKRATESVVKTALKALERGKSYAIDGRGNYLAANLVRFAPRGLAARMTGLIMRPKKRE